MIKISKMVKILRKESILCVRDSSSILNKQGGRTNSLKKQTPVAVSLYLH